jgi:hypothetical protein
MFCIANSNHDTYAERLNKTRANVLNSMYNKKAVDVKQPKSDNMRLRLRYKEAIEEAHRICEKDKNSGECHLAWYEVDELEDSMMRKGFSPLEKR